MDILFPRGLSPEMPAILGRRGEVALSLTPDGRPGSPTLVIDRKRDTYFWGGSAKTASDLTADSTGWAMTDLSWLDVTVGWTVMVEWDQPAPPTIAPSGVQTLFALANTANGLHGMDMSLRSSAAANDSARGQPVTTYADPSASRFYTPLTSLSGDSDISTMMGRKRAIFSFNPAADFVWMGSDGFDVTQGAAASVPVPTFNRVCVGFRQRAGTKSQYFAGDMDSVSIYAWPFPASRAQVTALAARSPEGIQPIHVFGDSFLNGNYYENGGGLVDCIRDLAKADGYAMWSDFGQGGTSITQQVDDFAAQPRYFNSTLLPLEIGLDGTATQFIAALERLRGMLRHDRWLVFEPIYDTNKRAGSAARTTLDGYVSEIQAHLAAIGYADRWVPTKAGMQAAARPGNATDEADVADDIWPRDTTYWSTDGLHNRHPADLVLAQIIYDAVKAKGWL